MTGEDWTSGTPELLTSVCADCGHRWYIARERCPRCNSARIGRVPSAPAGRVVAVTSMSPKITADGVGVSIALVDLDDGIRIMARCAPDLDPGVRVRWFLPESADDRTQHPSVPHLKVVDV